MQFAIIISQDLAGENIKKNLLNLYDFEETDDELDNRKVLQSKQHNNIKIYTLNGKCLDHENLHDKINADLFIFATTHRSESGIPSLSVHPIGNWGEAKYGGKPKTLYPSSAFYLKTFYQLLKKNSEGLDYDIVNEITHHGPQVLKPVLFIEIGSSEKQWPDPKAGEAIAKTIMEALTTPYITPKTVAIAIGGQHTASNFNKIVLNTDITISHFCPKYNLENLNKEMLQQAIDKTVEPVNLIIVDWKGLGQFKEKVKELLEGFNLEWKKTKDIGSST